MHNSLPQFARRQCLGHPAVGAPGQFPGAVGRDPIENWFETRTELFEFCPATVRYASESESVS